MANSKIRAKGQLTIPSDIREAAHLDVGTMVEFDVTERGVLLRPKALVDAEDAWFWTPEWQEGEREAQAELTANANKARKTYTHDEFLDLLEDN